VHKSGVTKRFCPFCPKRNNAKVAPEMLFTKKYAVDFFWSLSSMTQNSNKCDFNFLRIHYLNKAISGSTLNFDKGENETFPNREVELDNLVISKTLRTVAESEERTNFEHAISFRTRLKITFLDQKSKYMQLSNLFQICRVQSINRPEMERIEPQKVSLTNLRRKLHKIMQFSILVHNIVIYYSKL